MRTGEKIMSATMAPAHGHGLNNHLRSSGTRSSQARMLAAKKTVEYLENIPRPNAAPTASHHSPRPVSASFARARSRKQVVTMTAESGVARIDPHAMASVKLKNNAA